MYGTSYYLNLYIYIMRESFEPIPCSNLYLILDISEHEMIKEILIRLNRLEESNEQLKNTNQILVNIIMNDRAIVCNEINKLITSITEIYSILQTQHAQQTNLPQHLPYQNYLQRNLTEESNSNIETINSTNDNQTLSSANDSLLQNEQNLMYEINTPTTKIIHQLNLQSSIRLSMYNKLNKPKHRQLPRRRSTQVQGSEMNVYLDTSGYPTTLLKEVPYATRVILYRECCKQNWNAL